MSAEQSRGRLDVPSFAPAFTTLALRCQLHYDDVEAFVRGYAVNLSPAGMFIATREPPAVGTVLRFELVLADQRPVLRGEGQVVWTVGGDQDPSAPGSRYAAGAADPDAPGADALCGLGVRFGRLDAASRAVVARVLAHKAAHPDQFFTQVPDPYATQVARPSYRPTTAVQALAAAQAVDPEPVHAAAAPAPEPVPVAVPPAPEPVPVAAASSATPALAAETELAAPAPAAAEAPREAVPVAAAFPPEPIFTLAAAPVPAAPSAEPLREEPLPPLPGLPTSQWSPTAIVPPAPQVEADEEAALQALLQPVASAPLPTATDAARLLEELLERRPG